MDTLVRYIGGVITTTKYPDFGTFAPDEAQRIRDKYPDRVPVLVGKSPSTIAPDIDKHKFLVPMDLTMGQFQYVIRKRLQLSPDKAIFIFVGGTVPPTSSLMSVIYEEFKDLENDFLFVTYSMESTFG